MGLIKKTLKWVVVLLLVGLNVGVIGGLIRKHRLEKALEAVTQIGPDGISSLEPVAIGGAKQWILIRGEDRRNPVALYIHGGPGSPHMFMARHNDRSIEKEFVVVSWDQRGAGKSFSPFVASDSLNKEQFLADTHELVQLLKKRFNVPKIYIMGHSWGSWLAAVSAHRHPEDFIAYVGIGQMVNAIENEQVSYRYVVEEARREKNARAIQELDAIGTPPYASMRSMMTQRRWLQHYGGSMFYGLHRHDAFDYMGGLMTSSPEYSLLDEVRFFVGLARTLYLIWPQFFTLDLYKEARDIQVPVYFMAGRHDYNTPFEIVLKYEKVIVAPKKTIIWFENSAHAPNFEEPEAFGLAMQRVKRETYVR